MWSALRSRVLSLRTPKALKSQLGFTSRNHRSLSSLTTTSTYTSPEASSCSSSSSSSLDLQEVEKVLNDVKAGDVRVIPIRKQSCDWADYMVLASGRSTWHVKNIAQALVYKAKQKQKGAARLILPSVEGQEGGKWVVVDSGKIIVHALDEKARAYYDLESLWTGETPQKDLSQDLEKAFVKIRPKNNSKRRVQNHP